ncbi:Shikimate O-hydroxycinnamoyltransferase [Phytophthora citrophthora]|uniref:Shikimate O-hydroxycinnamoyltransferase n=1 Tax=Phytophthora citrophthora TaxID=4793 RepID=A0AAD9GU76_9STRA|nr:Shikimate O-hydroxycinnamoyltransferase [Phytophthora citrophthora]
MTVNRDTKIIDLSPMDAVMANIGVTILLIYAPSETHHYDMDILKKSFVETLDRDYQVLLGELISDSKRHGMPCVKLDTVTLSEGGSAVPFAVSSACHETTEEALESLSYDFMPPARKGKHQLIAVKCSVLSDGGLVLGLDFAHGVLDGEAAFTFAQVWGQYYRKFSGISVLENPIKLNHDRSLLAAKADQASLPHPEFQVLPPGTSSASEIELVGPLPVPAMDGTLSTSQRMLHLSPNQLSRLKTLVSDVPNSSYVSTIDSLSALLTVLITRARGHGQDVRIATCVNGREHLKPPLPANYVGNVIFNAVTTYQAAELASDSSATFNDTLGVVARRIRSSIKKTRDDHFLRDSLAFISSQQDMTSVFVSTNFIFGHDIFFTSWVRMGAYDADFGGGKPHYAGLPRVPVTDGLVVIADPMYPAKDGLDVIVLLETGTMKRFSEQWEELAL